MSSPGTKQIRLGRVMRLLDRLSLSAKVAEEMLGDVKNREPKRESREYLIELAGKKKALDVYRRAMRILLEEFPEIAESHGLLMEKPEPGEVEAAKLSLNAAYGKHASKNEERRARYWQAKMKGTIKAGEVDARD